MDTPDRGLENALGGTPGPERQGHAAIRTEVGNLTFWKRSYGRRSWKVEGPDGSRIFPANWTPPRSRP
jgi:hypothetical protein